MAKIIITIVFLLTDAVLLFGILSQLIKIPGNRKLLNVYDTKKKVEKNSILPVIILFLIAVLFNFIVIKFYVGM